MYPAYPRELPHCSTALALPRLCCDRSRIVLLLQLIWDLRVFAQIRILQDAGAPVAETNLLGNFIYELGMGRHDFGAASAVSLFVLALTIFISWPYIRVLLKEDQS